MEARTLEGKVAVVTGGSRGVGKGVALGLGEAGAKVYVSGRTVHARRDVGGTILETAEAVTALGGRGVAVECDHRDDSQTEALFRRVATEEGKLDILVNAAWGGYEGMFENGQFTWPLPFWMQPQHRWDGMFEAGVRACYAASAQAARLMVERKCGLIVNISFWAARKYVGNVLYGCAKAATDKMTADMAVELGPHNVAVVSLYPGMVRTERVMQSAPYLDLTNSESPQFVGRAVAALAADQQVVSRSGQVLVAASLAEVYGFTDLDGSCPRPLTLETV